MTPPSRTAAQQRKRVRFEPDAGLKPSVPDESALASSRMADESAAVSDHSTNDNSDSDSELSESSEEPSSESSSEDESDGTGEVAMVDGSPQEQQRSRGITNLRAGQGQKPNMRWNKDEFGPDIRVFLKDFLPQLKAANDELEAQRKAGTLKSREIDMPDADQDEQYIEMDLGLGVLEEKTPHAADSSASDSDDTMEDGEGENDVLGKLMGRASRTKDAIVIEEVRDAQQ